MKVIDMKNKIISFLLLCMLIYPPLAFSNGPRVTETPNEESSLFSFDIITNFFRNLRPTAENNVQNNIPTVTGAENSIGNPDISEIILKANLMTSGMSNIRLQPFSSVGGFSGLTDCPPRKANPFGSLESVQLCSKQGIYRETYSDQVTAQANRVPENYVLQLDPENVNLYCHCVREVSTRYNIIKPANSFVSKSKREKVVNNLLKTGIQRLAARFNELSPKVMYALTSSEMASLHVSQKYVESETGTTIELEQKSVLNACAPGQFSTLLKQMIQDENSTNQLCSKEGARRLGIGFARGRGHDCSGERARSRHCQEKSSYGLMLHTDISPEQAIWAVGRHVSRNGNDEISGLYLNRHYSQLESRGMNIRQTDIVRVLDEEESWQNRRNSGHQNELSSHLQDAVWNEMSKDGQRLWMENNGPILRALELYSKNGVLHDDQITGSLDYFKSQTILNPYLGKFFPNIQERTEQEIKQDIINYVTGPLSEKLAIVTNKKNRDVNKDIGLDDINAAMFLTYVNDYKDVVKECEDIQKTLISLCQAATNYGAEVEQVTDFFVNPLLIKLFNDDHLDIYNGKNVATTDDLLNASGMFCQDLDPVDVVLDVNNQAKKIQQNLENAPFLADIKYLGSFLDKVANDKDLDWQKSSLDYLARENGASDVRNMSHESLANSTHQREVRVSAPEDRTGTIVAASYPSSRHQGSSLEKEEAQKTKPVSSSQVLAGDVVRGSGEEFTEVAPTVIKPAQESVKDSPLRTDSLFQAEGHGMDIVPSSFMENFANRQLNQELNQPEASKGAQGEPTDQELAQTDPIQAELLAQLERMRAREEAMSRQIADLKESIEDEKDQRKAEQYEREQKALKKQVENLTAQLNERKAEVQKAAVTSSQGFTGNLGGNTGARAASSAPRVQPTASAASQNTAVVAPGAAPSSANPARAAQSVNSSSNGLASGNNFGLISSQGSLSGAARGGQRVQAVSIAAGDTNLAAIARSVEGNTALRQTSDPQVLEKIIFKEVDGQIVFVDGQPVIERTELLTLEEAQMLEENEALAMEETDTNERAPASIEEQMKEIEQSLYPRSRIYSAEELADEINRGRRMQD